MCLNFDHSLLGLCFFFWSRLLGICLFAIKLGKMGKISIVQMSRFPMPFLFNDSGEAKMIQYGSDGFCFAFDLLSEIAKNYRKFLQNTLPEPRLRGLF